MCDYSLQNVKSRAAQVGDKLTTRNFGTGTGGFAAPEDSTTAVCLLPGTECHRSKGIGGRPTDAVFGDLSDGRTHPDAFGLRDWQLERVGAVPPLRRVSRHVLRLRKRRDSGDPHWFIDRSHAPHHCPHRTDPGLVGRSSRCDVGFRIWDPASSWRCWSGAIRRTAGRRPRPLGYPAAAARSLQPSGGATTCSTEAICSCRVVNDDGVSISRAGFAPLTARALTP